MKRYRVIAAPETTGWEVHLLSCPQGREALERGEGAIAKLDLESEDEELLDAVDPQGDATIEDLFLCACTGFENDQYVPVPEEHPAPIPPPQPVHAAAAASKAAAAAKLIQQVEETIEKLVAKRGVDDVGLGGKDQWRKERLPTCTDDYVFDLAVEVRKLREKGEAWWRVAYELGLPGSGASNKQGKRGSAFARRLWRAAWGQTYTGERSQRDSKATREARAMANEGRPYFTGTEDAASVIETVRGQLIHWVTRLGDSHGGLVTSAQEAYVHDDPKFIRFKQGPQGPYLEFYEQLDPAMLRVDPRRSITKSGPLRAIYLNRITRVGV